MKRYGEHHSERGINMIANPYATDVYDELKDHIAGLAPALRAGFKPAARNAGAQLELRKPHIFGPGLGYAGPVADVPIGAYFIILADPDKVVQLLISDHPDRDAALTDIAAHGRENFTWPEVVEFAHYYLGQYGGPPGKTLTAPPAAVYSVTAALFSAFNTDDLKHNLAALRALSGTGVCPALVGLFGPGSTKPNTISFTWPARVALAPYVALAVPAVA